MKILVLGSSGFIGRAVVEALRVDHDTYCGDRSTDGKKNSLKVDLLDQKSVVSILTQVKPEVIINCAGTVENSERALTVNPIITLNILQATLLAGLKLKKVIVSGSAGEYGIVADREPVNEDVPLMGTSFYARSKILESSVALALAELLDIPLIVTRIFNPIGIGMHPRFLLPNLIKQVGEIKSGERKIIELSRLDALRDYVNVLDIAEAIKVLVESDCSHNVYNIGSGKSITNKRLLDGIVKHQGISATKFSLRETSTVPEPNYAVSADISRMVNDLGWKPKYDIVTTISQIADSMKKQEISDGRK